MNFIKNIFKGFLHMLQKLPEMLKLFLGIFGQLWNIIRALCRHKWRCRKRCECKQGMDLPPEIHKRADPMIYAQYYLMNMGIAVTWDNPDIVLYKNGSPADSNHLEKNTEYEVRIRVWNNSYDGPAAGLPVHLSFLSFGVGTPQTQIGKDYINLGVKGSSNCPAFAKIKWTTPKEDGHYCLQAYLDWTDDANPNNNFGQENTNVGELHSPAHFTFSVKNNTAMTRRYVYEVDDYTLPQKEKCQDKPNEQRKLSRLKESQQRWDKTRATQAYGMFSNLPDWNIHIEPEKPSIASQETILVKVSIEPKFEGFKGTKSFNVNAFGIDESGNKLLEGGVTLTVKK
jgi:hypothetical protein